jgi:hypothetical protein
MEHKILTKQSIIIMPDGEEYVKLKDLRGMKNEQKRK